MPLSWNELNSDDRPRFQVAGFSQWRKRLSRDPWKKMHELDQRLVLRESRKSS
jgi:bifunctional non-homologous end joining protein LigD